MRGKRAAAALALAALLAPAATPPASGRIVTEEKALETAVLDRVNAVRRSHGLRPLRRAARLVAAAEGHAESMAGVGYFRHELYTPRRARRWTPFGSWIRWHWPGPGYSTWSAGENLAWGAPGLTARQTVSQWLASPGHRANLLAPRWRQIGVAAVHVYDPRGYFRAWTDVTVVAAEFGRRS